MPYSKQTWTNNSPLTPLSDTRLAYMENGIATAQAGVDLLAAGVFRLRDYGAVVDGSTDDTAAWTAIDAAMKAVGAGTLEIPSGTSVTSFLPSFVPKTATGALTYAVRGFGSGVSIIKLVGTSATASLSMSNPLFDATTGSTGAPEWSGFTIDGTGSSGGCSGLIWGDISYPAFRDIVVKNFTTGDGFCFYNGYGWTEGIQMFSCRSEGNLNQIRFDVGSGRQLGTVATTIASGATAQTAIAVSALTETLFSGQQLVLAAAPSVAVTPAGTGGVFTQTVTVTAAVAIGATSIPVSSFTAGAAFTSGTAAVHFGGYGSFDYMTIHSLYIKGAVNQNGWVSEVSRGLGQNVQRIGSDIRVTGNFRNGTGNTGILFRIKGNDTYSDTVWDWSCETGGSGTNHKSIQIDSTTGSIGGFGKFSAYGFTAATFAGGTYQFNTSGTIYLLGISDVTETFAFRQMRKPGLLNIAAGVKPSGYATSVTSGTSWRNLTGADVRCYLTVTFTGAGSVTFNVDTFNNLTTTNSTAPMWTGTAGQVITIDFFHYHLSWAKVEWTNATIAAPFIRYSS